MYGQSSKNIFWPTTHPNQNCTLCPSNELDTWPHLLSTCLHQYMKKGLRIAWHNKPIHHIAHTPQSNEHTQFHTQPNNGTHNNKPCKIVVPNWLLNCICTCIPYTLMASLRPNILHILGATINNYVIIPHPPSPSNSLNLIAAMTNFPQQPPQKNTTNITPSYNTSNMKGEKPTPSLLSQRESKAPSTNIPFNSLNASKYATRNKETHETHTPTSHTTLHIPCTQQMNQKNH